jgi:hypothetical protein
MINTCICQTQTHEFVNHRNMNLSKHEFLRVHKIHLIQHATTNLVETIFDK